MPPLKNAPSSMLMRAADTSPLSDAFGADVHAVSGRNIAANLAQNHNLARRDAGRHLAVAADGNAVAGKIDAAFDLAVDIQRLCAADFAFDKQALADSGLFARSRSGRTRLAVS